MKTILVVDDDKSYRDILNKKLSESGYHVVEATNGQEGLDLLKKRSTVVDLILLDLVMPVMDGLTFYYRIKNLAENTPIIILTNLSTSAYPTEIKDYIVKTDISLSKLVEKIQSYFT